MIICFILSIIIGRGVVPRRLPGEKSAGRL